MAEPSIELLETTLRLQQALNLARRGRLREAMAAVAPGGVPPDDLLSLQAMAALATFGGDYRTALPLWKLILVREPSHVDAARMIRAIELWQARPVWMQWVWWIVGSVFAAALLVVLLLFV